MCTVEMVGEVARGQKTQRRIDASTHRILVRVSRSMRHVHVVIRSCVCN